MPVMQIRPMRVLVLDRLVHVAMRVDLGGREVAVGVVVVIVVMSMPVLMDPTIVPVRVTVPLAEEKREGSRNEQGRPRLVQAEGLVQEEHG